MKIKCSKCQGNVEPITRAGQSIFLFCRNCKLPHDEQGDALFTTKTLADRYNPLQSARDSVNKQAPHLNGVAKTALEVAAIQGYLEAYFSGIKDGVLLAYSQDYTKGEPMMEKLGVDKSELIEELRERYRNLKEKEMRIMNNPLQKEAHVSLLREINEVQSKIDELLHIKS